MAVAPARIAMAAGEVSGDLLAGLVMPALKAHVAPCECAGIGGDRMIAEGFDPWWHVRELSVRGYAEVLRHLPRLLRIRRDLMARTIAWPARVYVGVDAPDFNLGIEVKLRQAGIRTVQYVAPTVWAWRPERIETVKRGVEHLLPVFPFEEKIFADAGVRTTYVGHPLAATVPQYPDAAAARRRLGLKTEATTVAVLPGSRQAEMTHLGPPFFATVGWLQARDASMQFAIPAASEALRTQVLALLDAAGVDRSRVVVTQGRSHDCLEAADAVLVAGGTATLETLLFGKPMVIAYKVPWLTAWITKRKALIPYFGLPNILSGQHVVPEFVQDDVNPQKLGPALMAFLDDAAHVATLRERFAAIRSTLERDTPGLVAQAIADAVKR